MMDCVRIRDIILEALIVGKYYRLSVGKRFVRASIPKRKNVFREYIEK